MNGSARPPITPVMKVAEFLAAYPELENVLVAHAPAFARLRSPLLRRTVARAASLQQAAAVGGLEARMLVASLRAAAGQESSGSEADQERDGETDAFAATEPAWVSRHRIWRVIDADALLAAGEVPLPAVMAAAASLAVGELLRVDVAFRPAPLLEALHRQGLRSWVRQIGPDRFEAYFERTS